MAQPIILVTGPDPITGIGGAATFVRAHARAATLAGFEPHVFCWSGSGGRHETEFGTLHRVQTGSALEHLPWFKFRPHKMVWRSGIMARAVATFAAGLDAPRLVHSFGSLARTGVEATRLLRSRGLQATAVLSEYDTTVREARAKLAGVNAAAHGQLQVWSFAAELLLTRLVIARLERRAYAAADRILVNYASVQRTLDELYGVGAKVRKVAYAPESVFLRGGGFSRALTDGRARRGGEPPLIVTVSRHDPRKGLDVLIRALARLRDSGTRFRAALLGGGALLLPHRRLVERLGLTGVVRVEGFVAEPHRYLAEAHVFAHSALEEGSGSLALLEALQAGTAVVATGVDGIPEDVTDGDTALLVPPGDPDALAAALRRVLGDDELRRALARRGHAVFEARFSAEAYSAGLSAAYAELGVTPDGR